MPESKKCLLRKAKGKFACLVCPLIKCVEEKEGVISDIERELLIIRRIELRNKHYDEELEKWVKKEA